MPKVTPLKVVSVMQRDKKRWRVSGPQILSDSGQDRYRGPLRKTRAEAESDLYDDKQRLAQLVGKVPALPAADILDASRALEIARPLGKSLEQLAIIARDHLANLTARKNCTFRQAWKKQILWLEGENRTTRHISTANYYLQLAERREFPDLDSEIRKIQAEVVRTWIIRLKLSEVSKLNWLRYARAVVNRAITDGYCELNVFEQVNPPQRRLEQITCLTPEQCGRLLIELDRKDLPFYALCLFAGLRAAEAQRLDWKDIDMDRKEIHVGREKAKTRAHRLVPMEDALFTWLDSTDVRKMDGAIDVPGRRKRFEAARHRAGIKWEQNVLRHSYGTYWLAQHQDREALSLRMGNSPDVISAHYARPISKSIAMQFWSLRPTAI